MPRKPRATPTPVVVQLRGEPPYDRWLTRLEEEARKHGVAFRDRSHLTEIALAAYAAQWGLMAPRRIRPHGTNRFGEPRAKAKAEDG